jgi:hypothetical protein
MLDTAVVFVAHALCLAEYTVAGHGMGPAADLCNPGLFAGLRGQAVCCKPPSHPRTDCWRNIQEKSDNRETVKYG